MPEPNVEPQEPTVVEPVVEPIVEGQGQTTTEPVESQQPDPNEQFLIKANVDGQEQIFDIRDAEQRKTLQDNVQKGIHYTKKMQSLSEVEKASQYQNQFAQGILSNPNTLEILVAQENGLNPASLYGTPLPPNEALKEADPVGYANQFFAYQTQLWEREKIKALAQAKGTQQASINNNALFEKARLENDLNDVEYNQVTNFMQMNFRPNLYGMFSKEQVDTAVMAITGKARSAQRQLNTIKKIDQSLKSASQPMNVSQKTRILPKPEEDRSKFHDFVRDVTKRS
jgi:hypothetical protein